MSSVGKVKWFNFIKGFGFIEHIGEDGEAHPDLFVHASDVVGNPLKENDEVRFDISDEEKPRATKVTGGTGWPVKGKGKRRPGDWECPSCNVNNFASRQECFKCGTAKPE